MTSGYLESGVRGFRLVSTDGSALTTWRKHRTDAYKEFNNKRSKNRKLNGRQEARLIEEQKRKGMVT